MLELRGAKLCRSFSKVGWMSPFAIVTVATSEVFRTSPARRAHKQPQWDASLSLPATPDNVTVSIWDKNDFHRNVFCGAVTIPCSHEMGRVEMDFELTKAGRPTGTLAIVLEAVPLEELEGTFVTEHSIGAEMDLIISYVSSRQTTPAGSPNMRRAGLALPGSPARSLNPNPEMPTTMASTPMSMQQGQTSFCFAEAVLEGEGDEEDNSDDGGSRRPSESGGDLVLAFPASDVAPASGLAEEASAIAGAEKALGGPWTCVATQSLEAFLKATGINVFQRKIACAARWPSWSFSVVDDRIIFLNNTAIGVLREEIPLGRDYTSIDGKGNALASHATWTPTASGGGVLLIERGGALGKYKEERTVTGDSLEFVLTNLDVGCSWGRSFARG